MMRRNASLKLVLLAPTYEGAQNWGIIASLIEIAKLNKVDPYAYLTAPLQAIVEGHKKSLIEQLLPWNYAAQINDV